jgi:hypothetical protein
LASGGEPLAGAVEALYEDYRGLVADLEGRSPSSLTALNRAYPKHLLLAAASSLEELVKRALIEVFEARGDAGLGAFVQKRILDRGYHQLFAWTDRKAQPFFSSFGPDVGASFKRALRESSSLAESHEAFMILGSARNEVVHRDFASYPVEFTPEEVIEKYRLALYFVEQIAILVGSAQQESS